MKIVQILERRVMSQAEKDLRIKFATDKEYNIMWECTVLLLAIEMLHNITPALSVAVPFQELEEVKNKLKEWVNKLSSRIEVINP